jgi:hypothetical protein
VREVLNIFQADECGCKIVTVPHDILNKAAKMLGTDLTALSLDTVKMFAKDAAAAGFKTWTELFATRNAPPENAERPRCPAGCATRMAR